MSNELNKFEQQLKEIRLSTEQKKHLLSTVYTKRNKKNYTYPAVLMSFFVVALFLLVISLQPSSGKSLVTAANGIIESFIIDIPKNLIQWGVATLVSFLLAVILAIILLFKSTRWNDVRIIQYGREVLTFKRNNHLIMLTFLIVLFVLVACGIVIFTNSLHVLHGYFVVLYCIHTMLILLWLVKDDPTATCPCCSETLPKDFIMTRLKHSSKKACPHCAESLYLTKKSRRKFYLFTAPYILGYLIMGVLGISMYILVMIFGLYYLIFTFISPYVAQFTDDPQYVW